MENLRNYDGLMVKVIERYFSYGGMVDFIPDRTTRCFICLNNQKKETPDIGITVDGINHSFHKDCIDTKAEQYWKEKQIVLEKK